MLRCEIKEPAPGGRRQGVDAAVMEMGSLTSIRVSGPLPNMLDDFECSREVALYVH